MEINLNRGIEFISKTFSGPARSGNRRIEGGEVQLGASLALEKKLMVEPDVRTEAVERARELLRSASYPPAEAIEKIATLLAANWEKLE